MLTVSGLHSYREPVTVDFEDLGRFGLFGIFGAIGSGKSTLLDAITLALFGLVDRVATRSRRGIVHLGAERCEVRFRFAVDTPGGAETWEVHRAYRDQDGVAVRVASRLVRRDGSRALVVAEKERDVNQAVTEVVGLGPEDFTRAVVLPQGRFVQLLHLKGPERRQMLSRMFRLQAYGEGLRLRVRDRQAAVVTERAAAEGELTGLGDASPQAVQRARVAADRAERAAIEAERGFVALRDRHDLAVRVRDHAARVRLAAAALADHESGAAKHAALLARIAEADRVGPWIAPARRYAGAVDRARTASEAASSAVAELSASERAVSDAYSARDAARARADKNEPALRDRLRRLHDVAQWMRERVDLDDKVKAATAERSARAAAQDEARRREGDARARAAAAQQARRALKQKLARVRVSADERERMVQAARAADALGAARRWLTEARAEETGARERAAREASLLEQATADMVAARAADVARAESRVHEARLAMSSATAALGAARVERDVAAEILRGAGATVRKAEVDLEAARRNSSAALLAASLAPGVPCPVCGSPHHPAPVEPVVHEGGERLDAILMAHRAGHERASARHDAAQAAHAAAQAEQARAAEGLAQAAASRDRGETSPALEQAAVARAATAAKAEAAGIARDQAAALHAQRAAEEGEAWSAFDAARGNLTLFDLPWALVGLDARDREAEQLTTAIEEAEIGHAAAVAEAEEAYGAAERAAAELAVWNERRSEGEDRLARLDAHIAAEDGPDEATTTDLLTALASAVREADAAVRDAEQARFAASGAAATTTADATAARADVESLERELDPILAGGAGALASLLAAHPDDATVASWRAAAVAWTEQRVALQARLAALSEGHEAADPPDDPSFARLVEELAAVRESADRTRAESSAARTQATDLAGRAERHDALTGRVASLDRDHARLEELGSLLRGDRFVEYVANDHLADLVARATTHLGLLTSGRYRLAVDDDASFLVHDDDAGGAVRPVHSLSGGESFLTALSLALALSEQMQAGSLRPLGFFFLDEGFGTLDPDALDRVMTAIERLRIAGLPSGEGLRLPGLPSGEGLRVAGLPSGEGLGAGHRLIGLISHVPAVRERVPRYLWVDPPAAGHGSSVALHDN